MRIAFAGTVFVMLTRVMRPIWVILAAVIMQIAVNHSQNQTIITTATSPTSATHHDTDTNNTHNTTLPQHRHKTTPTTQTLIISPNHTTNLYV